MFDDCNCAHGATKAFVLMLTFTLLFGKAAHASTLPPVDFDAGSKILAGGALDVAFDYAITGNFSVGVTMIPYPNTAIAWYDPLLSPILLAGRATYRIGTIKRFAFGVTLAAGTVADIPQSDSGYTGGSVAGIHFLRFAYSNFVQPAFVAAFPLGQIGTPWKVRFTIGPSFLMDGAHGRVLPLVPNLEISRSFGPKGELTFLGDSIVGWRQRF